jgi:hypothetical protein
VDSIHNRSLLVSHTYAITPRLLNEFRFGFTNAITSVNFPISGAAALQQLNLTGVDISQHPTTNAFPTFNFTAGTGFTPIGRDKTGVTQSKTIQFTDNVTYSIGKHTLKVGTDIRRVRYFDVELFLPPPMTSASWQARVSFAYRPFHDTKTVLRGGFGIFTMTNLGPLSFNNSGNPTSNLHTYTNSSVTDPTGTHPLIQFPNRAPPTVGMQYGGGGLDQGVDPNYRDPQSEQWNLTVERQLQADTTLRVSYVGMHTYLLNITEDLNQIQASTTPYSTTAASSYVDPRAPYTNWFSLYSTFNAGTQNYQALEVDATHRLSHGLYFEANYTLAKNLANNQGDAPSAFAGEVNYGVPVADRFNLRNNYGNVEGTRHNRFLLTSIYQLPAGRGRQFLNSSRLADILLGGWDLTNITLLETGPWLTPSISGSFDQSNTNVVNRGATLRPDVVSKAYGGRGRGQYFNLAAFAPTPAGSGRFGNAGVGILQGPGTATVSLGLAKNFAVTERAKLRFESTFTNVLNHTNFAPPATQIDNAATFGVLSAPQTAENAGNRTGQLALRLEF